MTANKMNSIKVVLIMDYNDVPIINLESIDYVVERIIIIDLYSINMDNIGHYDLTNKKVVVLVSDYHKKSHVQQVLPDSQFISLEIADTSDFFNKLNSFLTIVNRENTNFNNSSNDYLNDLQLCSDKKEIFVKCIENVFNYSNKLCCCFNGGKDCLVVLILLLHYFKTKDRPICDLKVLNVRINPFKECDSFVRDFCHQNKLILIEIDGKIGMKHSLTLFKQLYPDINYFFMGTRRTDHAVGSSCDYLQPTDPSWPQLIRVNPILDWNYNEIWNFIKKNNIPYCSLYDKGYSSLGPAHLTSINPFLVKQDASTVKYLAPWDLIDSSAERNTRI